MLCLKVPKQEGEKVRNKLLERNLLSKEAKIASEGSYLLIPVKEDPGSEFDYPLLDRDLEIRERKETDYTKLIGEKRILDEEDILELGEFASSMFEDALSTYDSQDAESAKELVDRDDKMDKMCENSTNKILGHLIEKESETLSTDQATRLGQQVSTELLTIRDLERVADHAANIAARTIYLVTSTREMI